MFGAPKKGDKGKGVPAVVVEVCWYFFPLCNDVLKRQNLREHLHVHLCDARPPLSELKPHFPSFTYPPEMTDKDELWQPADVRGRELEEELVARLGKAVAECLDRSGKATCTCSFFGCFSRTRIWVAR
jgi:hypothetical protein